MTSLLIAMQAAVEALPEDAPPQPPTPRRRPPPRPRRRNGLDLLQLVLHASLPVQLVMLLLLVASVASWVIIFRKTRVLDRAEREAERVRGALLVRRRTDQAVRRRHRAQPRRRAAWRRSSKAGFREFARLRQRKGVDSAHAARRRAARDARDRPRARLDGLEHNLELLANVGSTAPYVGLVGTVFGIMITFHGLANVKQATIATVAPGISEALIATAMGLFAAIPAVWAYNRFATSVERLPVRYDALRRGVLLDPAAPGARRRA